MKAREETNRGQSRGYRRSLDKQDMIKRARRWEFKATEEQGWGRNKRIQ